MILAAGAIGSPHLLLLSGVGPAAQLREHGVGVVLDRAGIGKNLHDHLQLRLKFRFDGLDNLNRQLIGLDGLRVIDASVTPAITSGNTNAPTLMIAGKGAAMMKTQENEFPHFRHGRARPRRGEQRFPTTGDYNSIQ